MRASILLPLAALTPLLLTASCKRLDPPPVPPTPPAPGSGSAAVQPAPPPNPSPPSNPSEDPSLLWWSPLPPVSLGALTQAEETAAASCIDAQRLQSADVTSDELYEAAQCFGAHRAFGKEIRLYMHLNTMYPSGSHAAEVLVLLGQRYEQLDQRARAVAPYWRYLSRYPKQEDAPAVGKRAVCLARSVGDDDTAQVILSELERDYGRGGFVIPPEIAFEQLCGPIVR